METAAQNDKERLCKEMLEKMFLEAEKEASELFIEYPETVIMEFGCSGDDRVTIANRLLYYENEKYDKTRNFRNIEKVRAFYLEFFIRTNEIYDKEMKFNNEGYDAQKRSIMEQILVVKKTEYLKGLINDLQGQLTTSPNEKLTWNARLCDFSIMINQLVDEGFIKPPLPKKGDKENYKSQLASICHSIFYIPSQDGTEEVTQNTLYQEIKKPSLTDPDTFFFKIVRKNRK